MLTQLLCICRAQYLCVLNITAVLKELLSRFVKRAHIMQAQQMLNQDINIYSLSQERFQT